METQGNNIYEFKLDSDEIKKFEKWRKKQMKKNPSMPTAGERWTFCFTPTGLGTVVEVHDGATNKSINLTDFDKW
jgi:hypothetical protein